MAKATAKKAPKKSFDDILGSSSTTKKAAKKKASNSAINPVSKDVQEQINALLKAKAAKKVAESDIKKAETKIIEVGNALKDERAFKGAFSKSYRLGDDDANVNFVTTNKWSFDEEDIEEITDILGENADEMIIEQREVKLKDEVFSDPELREKFVKMVGDQFPEFFQTVVSHKVSDDFDEKIYKLGKHKVDDLRMVMIQAKPSIR